APMIGDLSIYSSGATVNDFFIVDLEKELQEVDYTYNIRGWLKTINDVDDLRINRSVEDMFAFKINYNTYELGEISLFNGNISETLWNTANEDPNTEESHKKRGYNYTYDALNRIKDADFHKLTGVERDNYYNLSNISYDKNGNILTLARTGVNNSGGLIEDMDDLTYKYNGNQLDDISEAGNHSYGFKDFENNQSLDYKYDDNGNMTEDLNKEVFISYNHLNLPTSVIKSSQELITYTYDATGVKLSKSVTENLSTSITNYANNFIYKDGKLEFFNHPEGYVEPNDSGGFSYVYSYLDHIGNIRLNYSDLNNDGAITTNEILEENNFYPFGLKHKGYNNVVVSEHDWKFQGQELTEDLGLNVYEWRYRTHDPALGRFWQVDPLTEDYEWMTPYQFSSNQPIHAQELEGLESMNDLNSRDPNLKNATKEEMAAFHKGMLQAGVFSAAVTVDVLVTKGAITKSLLQQTALNTTINGANQLLEGGVENLDFGEAVGDAIGNADLFDAGMDALTSKLPGGKIINEVIGNVATSMVDVTNDGGIQMGGVNKNMSDVATDLTFSAVTSSIKNVNVPNVKFSGTGLGKSIKNGVIDVVSGSGRNNLPSSNTKPAVGRRKSTRTSERSMNIKVRDNTRVRQ
ncbi:RHS repeat domain-containing protein, partial [Psychroserpens sp.]